MVRFLGGSRLAGLSMGLVLGLVAFLDSARSVGPETVYWESAHLAATKDRVSEPEGLLKTALEQLRSNADLALDRGPYSVIEKQERAPSGDPHDYLSFSRYWWPNPDTSDTLPYIRRDGQTNRALVEQGDRVPAGMLFEDIQSLALAYYLLGDQAAADHAAQLIRVWFLDPATRMNPNLNYAQGVPGIATGRGTGIIDMRGFIHLLDSTALIAESSSLTPAEQLALQKWFREYLEWLLTSELAQDELEADNNHGSWYAAQVARIALFVGDDATARRIVESVRDQRIPAQFLADGSQPAELKRTRSLHYSLFNLSALAVVARVGEQLGVDLWKSETPDGASLRTGLEFVAPYLRDQSQWPHEEIEKYKLSLSAIEVLRMASVRFDAPGFLDVIQQSPHYRADVARAALVFAANPAE